ncbi:amino acid permease [Enterococcus hulanensis]|uniref:APC family permease n=1 Tax=Enterococcus hulanensis TaxID=2559929 RepID=UPI001A8CE2B4|nr:amino acid permease [Enterococcus hulanensis]MBO0458241.1 amino acid permease [Enterococcus hulanensis]
MSESMVDTNKQANIQDSLKRTVSGFSAYTMVVGTVIGTGIFFKPQAIFEATGTASLGLISWLIGCFLGICGGLIIAEIGALIPETGGLMTYIEKIYSKPFGFMVGWAQTIVFYPIRKAASAVVFGIQTVALFGLDTKYSIPIACTLTLYLFLINILGNKIIDYSISIATILKFVPIVLIIIFGIFLNNNPTPVEILPITSNAHPFIKGLSISVISTLYATDGWINITNIAGEIKDPQKNIPKALIGGLLTVSIVYLIINVAYLRAMTPAEMAVSSTVGSDVAGKLIGEFGRKIVAAGILISILGSHTGFTRASWRVPYALALRDWLPYSSWFTKVNKKNMPVNSGIFITIVTVAATIFLPDFNILTDIGSYVIWVFYTMAFIGLFILRKRWPNAERYYKVPLYPFIPILGIAGGIFVIISTTFVQPTIALLSIILVLIGMPIYYFKVKKQSDTQKVVE